MLHIVNIKEPCPQPYGGFIEVPYLSNGHIAVPLDHPGINDAFDNALVGFHGVENLSDLMDSTDIQDYCVGTLGYASIMRALHDGAISQELADKA